MDLGSWLFGSKSKNKRLPTLNPNQLRLLNSMTGGLESGGGYAGHMDLLNQFMDPNSEQFKNFENLYMNQFNEQIVPQLAERFAGANAMGSGLSSSGFGQALGGAGAGLMSQLAAMKSQNQMNALGQYFNQYTNALGVTPFGYQHQPGGTGLLGSMLGGAAGSSGSMLGLLLGR